ncbi:MAG: polysaccharide biosynthesis/export family protein [Pseudomonadota bacterium]
MKNSLLPSSPPLSAVLFATLLAALRAALRAAFLAPLLAGCASGAYDVRASATADGAPPVTPITEQLLKAEKKQREQRKSQDVSKLLVAHPAPYTIDAGDILSIVVWDHPELAGAVMLGQNPPGAGSELAQSGLPPAGFVVDHEGKIQFPYAGLLKVAGLTEDQARALLTAKLARYIHQPNVTLRIQAYRSKRIYIDGEVKAPGLQAINDIPMTLVEALNRAGGALPTADQSRILLEHAGTHYQIDLPQLMQKGINPGNILLAQGDVVRVPSRDESKVFVSGEVITPKSLTMHNGRLTLNEAMGESGGVSPLGDSRQVYVVRRVGNAPVVYQLDARAPDAMAMAEEFELNPRDVVYVAASPLANWHRRVSLLFPGALSSALGAVKP